MAEVAAITPPPRRYTARERWALPGSRHDTVVRWLRRLLPIGIGVLAAFLTMTPITTGRNISFVLAKDRVDVASERMRATEARYRGQDARGQAFELNAGSAVQATSRDPVVKLADLSATLQMADGPAAIVAPQGRYSMTTERVMIDGPVLLTAPDDYRVETRDVTIDLNTRQVASAAPVDGRLAIGTFKADRLNADLTARTVTLTGRARLHIDRGGGRGAR